MAIEIPRERRDELIGSIRRYFEENLDEEIGDLKARLLLDYFLVEVGPTVYNQGVADAQAWLVDRLGDLEGSCHEPEVGYWTQRR